MKSGRFEPVRIGVAGVGSFGELHALTLQGIAEAELVAVTHRRQNRLDEVAKNLPGVPGWTQLEQAVAESRAEAWIVASSTAAHVPMTRTILEAGKPVLLEKPLAASLTEVESLSSLVASDSSNLMLGHILLFNSEFRQLADEVRQRGPIAYLNCVRHRPVTTMELLPGESPLHLLMVHDLYVTQVLAERADPVHFDCRIHCTDSGAVDLAVGHLQWEKGMMADYAASFMTPSGMAADGFDRLEVFGKGWAARLDPNPRPMELWDERARWPMALEIRADALAPSGMMAEELRCFCRVVRGLEPVPVGATYRDAMQVQRWLDQLESAAATGR
ncbi:MAG: Gfo/Idh/MocA family protein [Planctomycetota bacterium]|jgi:predicted dehydrogenase